jgi:hypothetical protein
MSSAAALLAVALASCGGSSSHQGTSFVIEPPSRPSARECGVGVAPPKSDARSGKRSHAASAPTPGVYRYGLSGTETVTGAALRARDLPIHAEMLVSPARQIGRLSCFRIQRRLGPEIANTDTYVVRGGNIYLVGLVIQALGETQRIQPDPAVLSATNSASEWSGQFGGRTIGSYSFSVRGKERFRVGHRRLRAVRVTSVVTYRGAFTGSQSGTTWLSVGHHVVLGEKVRSHQGFGVSTLRLRTQTHLKSLRPAPLRNRD